jgi:hypothetical protein
VDLGGLIHHLVHDQRAEVSEHDVDYGTQSRHRGANPDSGKSRFRNGSIDHAIGSKLLNHPIQDLERCASLGDILAHDEHAGIPPHFFGERLPDGFA